MFSFLLLGAYFTSRLASLRAVGAGLFSGDLCRWPNHFRPGVSVILLHVFCFTISWSFTYEIFLCHLMFMTYLSSLLWKTVILLSKSLFMAHNSEIYKKILAAQALHMSSFIWIGVLFLHRCCNFSLPGGRVFSFY